MPRVNTTVLDALLGAVRSGTNIYVTESRPTDRASAIANALHSGAVVHAPGTISGSAGLGQDGGDRRYTNGPYNNILLNQITATQAPTFVAITDATNLLAVADIASPTAVSNNTTIDLLAWDHIVNAPTS